MSTGVRGRFITFEGGEGCGKSTQIRLLAERLTSLGHRVRELREPGGTALGEKIRHLLKYDPAGKGMVPEAELLLMNASRAQLVREVIRPALEAGEVVVCDRFFDSTLAYQSGGRGLPQDLVESVIGHAVGGTRPDLTLYLSVSRDEARRRVAARTAAVAGPEDRFEQEKEAFFLRVEAAYEALLVREPARVRPVPAEGAPEVVAERIWSLVQPLLAA